MARFPYRRCHIRSVAENQIHIHRLTTKSLYYPEIKLITTIMINAPVIHRRVGFVLRCDRGICR
jgi:hypothetical protein